MSETANALGLSGPWEYGGKSYTVAVRNLEMEALFEVFLERRALDVIRRHAPTMNGREYQANTDGWRQDCAAGVYTWGGPVCENARYCPPGARYMAYLQLKLNHPEVTEEFIDRVFRDPDQGPCRRLLDHVYGSLDPNPPAGAGKAPSPT